MIRTVLVVLLSLIASSAMAKEISGMQIEKHVQRYGGDYTNFNTKNARHCARECARDARCQAFDFNKYDKSCWLKDRIPPARQNRDITSGVKEQRHHQGGGNDVIAGIPIDRGFDRAGADYAHFGVQNARQCAEECANDLRCRAFDFNKNDRTCWLKDRVPPKRQNREVVSGAKGRSGQGGGGYGGGHGGGGYNPPSEIAGLRIYNNVKRNGGDYNNFIVGSIEECARACARDHRCQSFNFGKQRRDCWLKDFVPGGFPNNTVISGVKEGGGPVGGGFNPPSGDIAGMEIFPDVKRNGGDYTNFTVRGVAECAQACARDNRCRSFNYGTQRRDCWLKNNVPHGVPNNTVISGVKRR